MIRAGIRTYALTLAPLTALIDDRFYLNRVPEANTPYSHFPCVIYRRANGGYEFNLDGFAGYAEPNFEFMIPDLDSLVAEQVATALFNGFAGYRGMMGDVEVQRCTCEDDSDEFWETEEDSNKGFHQIKQIYKIGYTQSIPTF